MSLAAACEAEIRALHEFFEDWHNADRPRTDAQLERVQTALGPSFELVGPDGDIASRSTVLESIERGYGTGETGDAADRIDIRAVDPRFERDGLCLVTYEEHQRTAGTWRGRQSSALFEEAEAAPEGVVWLHLHETWLSE